MNDGARGGAAPTDVIRPTGSWTVPFLVMAVALIVRGAAFPFVEPGDVPAIQWRTSEMSLLSVEAFDGVFSILFGLFVARAATIRIDVRPLDLRIRGVLWNRTLQRQQITGMGTVDVFGEEWPTVQWTSRRGARRSTALLLLKESEPRFKTWAANREAGIALLRRWMRTTPH